MAAEILTQSDINQLETFKNNGSFGDYYGLLSSKGYVYTELALDVVNSQGRAGKVARAFVESAGKITGTKSSILVSKCTQISLRLIEEGFDARAAI